MKRILSRPRIWLLGLALWVATLSGVAWVLNIRAGDAELRSKPASAPAPSANDSTVVCIGHVDAEHGITSLHATEPGRVTDVLVHDDEVVTKGTVLLRIDDSQAKFLVQRAEQDLKAAQLQLDEARKAPQQHESKLTQQTQTIKMTEHELEAAKLQLQRLRNLQQNKQAPTEEGDAAAEQVKKLEAGVAAGQARLRELELVDLSLKIAQAEAVVAEKRIRLQQARYVLEECSLLAPADGKVLRIHVNPGDVVSTQSKLPAVQFCPNAPRVIRAEVEQEFANRVALGQAARIHDDRIPGAEWTGKVSHISDWYTQRRSILQEPLQVNDVRTLECIVQLDPDQPVPRIGQRVRVILGQVR